MKRGRKWLALILAAVFTITLTAPVFAAGEAQKDKISLEQAIKIVRQKLVVPDNCKDLQSRFEEDNKVPRWVLEYTDSRTGASFNAQVNAQTGEIIGMYSYKPSDGQNGNFSIPALTRTEAQQKAESLLNRLISSRMREMKLVPVVEKAPRLNWGQQNYQFRWQRYVSNVPVQGQGATVEIQPKDGNIIRYELTWWEASFPTASDVLSLDRAKQEYVNAGMLEEQYFIPQDVYSSRITREKPNPVLVYCLENPFIGVIDAETGKPLVLSGDEYIRGGSDYDSMGARKEMNAQSTVVDRAPEPVLTPEELKEVERTKNYLSQEQAESVARKYIKVLDGMELGGSSINSYGINDSDQWQLNFSLPEGEKGLARSCSVTITAASGELTQFYMDLSERDNSKPLLSTEETRAIGEKFLQEIEPERFKSSRLEKSSYDQSKDYYRSYYYKRLVNGIVCSQYGISVDVEASTGVVTGYNLNWRDLNFPGTAGTKTESEMATEILRQMPLTLHYASIYKNSTLSRMVLVYYPVSQIGEQPALSSLMFDAKTGQKVDQWTGKPLEEDQKGVVFTDIEGCFAEKEISLLGQYGLFKNLAPSFQPNKSMPLRTLLQNMLAINNSDYSYLDSGDDEIMNLATGNGWIKDEKWQPQDTVTREMLAKIMVRYLGMDKVAKVQGIFINTYTDTGKDMAGYAAILRGMNIMQGKGKVFRPQESASRADIAYALVHATQQR